MNQNEKYHSIDAPAHKRNSISYANTLQSMILKDQKNKTKIWHSEPFYADADATWESKVQTLGLDFF